MVERLMLARPLILLLDGGGWVVHAKLHEGLGFLEAPLHCYFVRIPILPIYRALLDIVGNGLGFGSLDE